MIYECHQCGSPITTTAIPPLKDSKYILCNSCYYNHMYQCKSCLTWNYKENLCDGLCPNCYKTKNYSKEEQKMSKELTVHIIIEDVDIDIVYTGLSEPEADYPDVFTIQVDSEMFDNNGEGLINAIIKELVIDELYDLISIDYNDAVDFTVEDVDFTWHF